MDEKIEEKVKELKAMGVNVKEEETKPAEDSGDGDKPAKTTLVDDTNLAAKRMEDATKEAKEERLAAEESYSKMKLSGQTEGGQEPVKKTEDEEWAEGAKERYAGTGMNPTDEQWN